MTGTRRLKAPAATESASAQTETPSTVSVDAKRYGFSIERGCVSTRENLCDFSRAFLISTLDRNRWNHGVLPASRELNATGRSVITRRISLRKHLT